MRKLQRPIDQLLEVPYLAQIVPRLEPRVLERLVQACGLEECADVLALATPAQIARVLDGDVWRARGPGQDEEFDPDRFGLWVTVLMQSGAAVAAEKLLGLDAEFVIGGLAQHIAAFDGASVASYTTLDGEEMPGRTMGDGLVSELGGYVIEARRTSAWEAILDLLAFLQAERPQDFHSLVRGCVRLSDDPRVPDGLDDLLDDRPQAMFDLASRREGRREARGYIAPAQARAFLQAARDLPRNAGRPARSPVARAYFRAMESRDNERGPLAGAGGSGIAGFVEVFEQTGVLAARPLALPAAEGERAELSFIEAHAASNPNSEDELAFVANAIRAGCSIQGRPFTVQEASDCAVRTCNLGLESWPPQWPERDLTTAFQVGWTILHRDVCRPATERLIEVLGAIRCGDSDIRRRVLGLRRGLVQNARHGEPWRAGDVFEVILTLDAPAWAALRALIDECPAIHAAVSMHGQARQAVDPTAFEFIARRSQIAAVRRYLDALPSLLAG